jgi:hypothetical protein
MGALTVALLGIGLAAGTITFAASLRRHRDASSPIAISKLESSYSVTDLTWRDEFWRGAATKIKEALHKAELSAAWMHRPKIKHARA